MQLPFESPSPLRRTGRRFRLVAKPRLRWRLPSFFLALTVGCAAAGGGGGRGDGGGSAMPDAAPTDAAGGGAIDASAVDGGPVDPGSDGGAGSADGGGADAGSGGDAGPADGGGPTALCPDPGFVAPGCIAAVEEGRSGLCNQVDDDCDGAVDEQCDCAPGEIQPCFAGPPARRGIGGCADGVQRCEWLGEFGGVWGACEGGFPPSAEVCDGLDNDCNGCDDDIDACTPTIECPGPDDDRITTGVPFEDYVIDGPAFFDGVARSWSWTLTGGPCDEILPAPSFTFEGTDTSRPTFRPTLSGDYTVTMRIVTDEGETIECSWIIPVQGPGLRVELCWPDSTTKDLDLFLSRPGYSGDWYYSAFDIRKPHQDVCGWHVCLPTLTTFEKPFGGGPYTRADWGYANSPLANCENGPRGAEWTSLGYCPNPRLDIDSRVREGLGLPENINVDAPRDGDQFRVMVQNFTAELAYPVVNIYCAGRRLATYGAPPDRLDGFESDEVVGETPSVGAMWRVADIVTRVDATGALSCEVTRVARADDEPGYDVTIRDARF